MSELLKQLRRVEADFVALIAEAEVCRLYAREATPSMFLWCTEALHLSDYETYLRIAVARASRKHPVLLTMLRDGRLHLSGIALLARHLTPENRSDILRRAAGQSHRQLKELIAELEPKPDAPAKIRKLPIRRGGIVPGEARELGTYQVPSPACGAEAARTATSGVGGAPPSTGSDLGGGRVDSEDAPEFALPCVAATPPRAGPASPARSATVEPLAPSRYKVQFTASAELRDKLARRWPVHLQRQAWKAVRQAPRSGVPPPEALRPRRPPQPGRDHPPLQGPQRVDGRARLRKRGDGALPALRESRLGAGGCLWHWIAAPPAGKRPGLTCPKVRGDGPEGGRQGPRDPGRAYRP